jgi:hypothetical protein
VPESPEELLAGLDSPRPLSSELRLRVEQALLAEAAETSARPLDDVLSARLEDTLSDPVATALADAERPRPLGPEMRRRLERALSPRRRFPLTGAAVAAGVVVLAGVGLGLGLSEASTGPSSPLRSTAALPAAPTSTNVVGGSAPVSRGEPASGGEPAVPGVAAGLNPAASAPSVPQVTGVDPASGPAKGGAWVTVTGSGLAATNAVFFDGTEARFEVVSGSELRALAPAHAKGTVDIQVRTPAGTNASSGADHYTYR